MERNRNIPNANNPTQPTVSILSQLIQHFKADVLATQETQDGIPTIWITPDSPPRVLRYIKEEATTPYRMLYDLTAIDERTREHREGQPTAKFSVVYHLLALDRNDSIRVKVPLDNERPRVESIAGLWPNANWYEREAYDMFGITFEHHPHLCRLLMPLTWKGYPLRKEHPARATEMGPYRLPDEVADWEESALQFKPQDWGMEQNNAHSEFMFLNLGPQHPGTHGVLRIVLQLDGEVIVDSIPDIGFHHRAQEKMAERQTWHTYIPYTDRVDYLGGVSNNFPYVLSVEKLAGIEIPPRAQVIRVMMAELYRISSHLVWYGTFAQDVGQLSPVFYMFNAREHLLRICEAITGDRLHPNWFRIGGVAQDLPRGWDKLVREFIAYLPKHLREWDNLVMKNAILKGRTQGIGAFSTAEAIDWGASGPALRATGLEWDARKKLPYSMYDQFEFDIPTATHGDVYDRGIVRVQEIRQSLRIIEQCLNNMPDGEIKSHHPLTTPPNKDRTMHDIETLINHFLNVSWGPVMPPGEAVVLTEGTKGLYSYYVISDGNTHPYRNRIRAPSFPHIQMVPHISRGHTIADLLAILGGVDFVLGEVDR